MMLRSMTGFGRYERVTPQCKITVEMKSVNHRYLDLSIKMPKNFNCFESAIRNLIKYDVQRGKVDMFINYEDYKESRVALKYNRTLAGEYIKYFSCMEEEFGIRNDVQVSDLLRCPEVFTMEQQPTDEEELWDELSETISKAAAQFVKTREIEGEQLKADLLEKLDALLEMVEKVESRSPEIQQEYKIRLSEKISEMLENTVIDEARVATEVAIFADKICVDEEIVRLKTHIMHMKEDLLSGCAVGRKLDFLAQEMNREANTTLSKANDRILSDIAISMKTEIEKIREQVQNIE